MEDEGSFWRRADPVRGYKFQDCVVSGAVGGRSQVRWGWCQGANACHSAHGFVWPCLRRWFSCDSGPFAQLQQSSGSEGKSRHLKGDLGPGVPAQTCSCLFPVPLCVLSWLHWYHHLHQPQQCVSQFPRDMKAMSPGEHPQRHLSLLLLGSKPLT